MIAHLSTGCAFWEFARAKANTKMLLLGEITPQIESGA